MTIRKLHVDHMKNVIFGRNVKLLQMGIRPRAGRLAMAAVSPVPCRVFERDIARKSGGTILVDASGSMGLTREALIKFLEFIPFGTIAYYSGTDSPGDPTGDLVVYAEKGKIFSGEDTPHRQGGNSIDLPALLWLLKQEGPRWMVTDKGFCGVADPYCKLALSMLGDAERDGKIKVYGSLKAARNAVKKQSETNPAEGENDEDE